MTGLLFGALSAVALFLPVGEVGYYDIAVSLRIAPPIVAGFFYGPVAGLVSGGIFFLTGFLTYFDDYSTILIACSGLGALAVTGYSVAIGKWLFGDERPPLCTAVIAAAYGVIVYVTVGSLLGLGDLPRALEVVLSLFAPMTVGTCLSVGLVVLVCGSWRGWWRGFFSSLNLALVFVGLAVSVTSTLIVLNAKDEGEAIVRHAAIDLTAEMESQERYMLHESAVNFMDTLAEFGRLPTHEELVRGARAVGVDCATIADANGRVVITTDGDLKPGDPIERDPRSLRPYLELRSGFYCPPFQAKDGDADEWVKHFAIPLPTGGFLRLSYLWSKFQSRFPQYILPTLEGRHIGETGYYLIFNERGVTELPVPDRPETKGLSYEAVGLDANALSKPYEKVAYARILGVRCRFVPFEPFGGYRPFAVLPIAETQGTALVISTLVALVLMLVCIVFRIVQVRFQKAQAKIDALRAEEEERRMADLALARDIQRAELRTDGTEGDGYRIASLMNAAREVGGDFYDYYELPDGRLVVTIADVSGKGIPAAFFMMKSRVTLKSSVHSSATLAEAVARANVRLSTNNPAEMFVTAFVGVYDRKTGEFEFVSAGHNPPLLRHASPQPSTSVEWLTAPRCPAMGNFAESRYRSARVTLAAGDRLFLYTDGVNEAMNTRGELFGNERLKVAVETAEGDLVPVVRSAVAAFADGAEQADDITMLELVVGC